MSVEESLLGWEVAGDHIPRGAVPGAQGSASQAFLRALDMPWSPDVPAMDGGCRQRPSVSSQSPTRPPQPGVTLGGPASPSRGPGPGPRRSARNPVSGDVLVNV